MINHGYGTHLPRTTVYAGMAAIALLCIIGRAHASDDYRELRVVTTGPGTQGQYFKHILLFSQVTDEARLKEIGRDWQGRFSNDIVFVYFFTDASKATSRVPNVLKASVTDHIPFVYQSNPFTSRTQLIDYRALNKEARTVGLSAEGKTTSQKEAAQIFFNRHKPQGVLSVSIYGDAPPAALFMEVIISKSAGRELLNRRDHAKSTARAWLGEFRDFCKREHRAADDCMLAILSDGDEIMNASQADGVKFP